MCGVFAWITRQGSRPPNLEQARRAVSELTHEYGLNIDTVRRLTDRGEASPTAVEAGKMCVEMRVRGQLAGMQGLQSALVSKSTQLGFDFSMQEDTVFRRNRRLVAFDMDSTLIAEEVMDELAKLHGVGEQVVAITNEAMAGKIDFKESFRRRARLLKGLPETALRTVATSVSLNSGAHRLLRALQHFGYKTAIVCGRATPSRCASSTRISDLRCASTISPDTSPVITPDLISRVLAKT